MSTTDIFGKIVTSDGKIHFLYGNGFTDGTETELKVQDIAGNLITIGTQLNGKTIRYIAVQCSDGSIATTLKLYDPVSGVIASWRGGERNTGALTVYNIESKNLAIPIVKGCVLKINTGY